MTEVEVTTRALRPTYKSHHQQTNTQILQAGYPSCRPANSVRALKGKIIPSTDLLNTRPELKLLRDRPAEGMRTTLIFHCYLRQRGYLFTHVSVCLSVCLLTGLLKN